MTIQMSCDHHGPNQGIPDNRSRKRMLEQLRAATAMSDALAGLFNHGLLRYEQRDRRVVAIIDAHTAIPLFETWLAWLQVAPAGDDWAEPIDPPAEITIPNLPEDA